MTRAVRLTVWICLGGLASFIYGQQAPLPLPEPAASGTQPSAVADDPQAPAADDQKPATSSTADPTKTDPRTGLPLTPDELHQREIDKFDPMKRQIDPLSIGPDPQPLTDRKQPGLTAPATKSEPLPGSVAASNAAQSAAAQSDNANATQDPAAVGFQPAGGEYTGPAVLSRSYTLARPMISRPIKWASSFGLSYSWDAGQAPGAANGVTSYESTSTRSLGYNWTFSGRHIWKRDQLGVSYNGSYSSYGQASLSGTNNSFNLDYAHVLSRRLSLQFVESLQDFSQNYSLENPVLQAGSSVANLNLATSPNVQLLNSLTRQSSSQMSLTFRQTSRLSYNLSSSYFIVGRTEGVGTTGEQFGGDINYRWTRKATVGAYYSYTNYLFSHNVSSSDSHSVGLIYSYAINSRMQLQTRLGVTRIESLGYETVPLPPALAALLGRPAAIINAYSLRRTSDISAQLVRDFGRRQTATLAFVHGQSPGNGVLLTSVQQSVNAGFSTSLLKRRLPVNVGVSYSTVTSTLQGSVGFYKSESASIGTSRQLRRGVSSSLQVSYQRYELSGSPLLEHSLRVAIGLSWSPRIDSILPF